MNSKIDQEVCTLTTVRKVAAMLNLTKPNGSQGALLPRGWHFPLLAADTARSALRSDGFPGFGVPMLELDFPRLLLGSRTVRYAGDIPIGAALERTSRAESLEHKKTATGELCVATIVHELRLVGNASDASSSVSTIPVMTETQTYLLLPARQGSYIANAPSDPAAMKGEHIATVVPDETLLFQYSALGFNSHKIHLDKEHARQVEGFPDLVVNGGLATLLLTEFLRCEVGVTPAAIKVRYLVPLFCGYAITMTANQDADGDGGSSGSGSGRLWRLKAYDHQANLAVDMEVTSK
jgi:3-methylfumaryl-CoA hydratase